MKDIIPRSPQLLMRIPDRLLRRAALALLRKGQLRRLQHSPMKKCLHIRRDHRNGIRIKPGIIRKTELDHMLRILKQTIMIIEFYLYPDDISILRVIRCPLQLPYFPSYQLLIRAYVYGPDKIIP